MKPLRGKRAGSERFRPEDSTRRARVGRPGLHAVFSPARPAPPPLRRGRVTSARCRGGGRGPDGSGPRRAHFLRRRCAATGLGPAVKASGVEGGRNGRPRVLSFLSGSGTGRGDHARPALQPPLGRSSRRRPGPRETTASAPSSGTAPPLRSLRRRPLGGVGGGVPRGKRGLGDGGRGPPLPARLFDRGGLSSVRPDRAAPPSRAGPTNRCARGQRRSR